MESKEFYESPLTAVVKVEQEGVVCASGTGTDGTPRYNGFNTEKEW